MKLTKTIVDSALAKEKDYLLWDADIKGFGLKVTKSGAKSYVFQYRTAEGKTRRYTIGKVSHLLTAEQARSKARELYSRTFAGDDPMQGKIDRKAAFTVNELLDDYLASTRFKDKAASTQYVDKGRIERHVRPLLGSAIADKLTASDVRAFQDAVTAGKTASTTKTKARGKAIVTGGRGTADKAVLILRAAYSWAISEERLTNNPCAKVEVLPPGKRTAIMESTDHYASFFKTLATMEEQLRIRPAAADALRFLALTGARRGEVVNMKWDYVNLRSGVVSIPANQHKTGRRTNEAKVIALSAGAREIIARQPDGNPDEFVFRPAKGTAEGIALSRIWITVREEAKLPADLTLHGLRHSVGSHLAMAGTSAAELMATLGHKQVSTTMRYIHFAEEARSTLAERAASVAMAGMAEASGKPKAEVLPIKRGK